MDMDRKQTESPAARETATETISRLYDAGASLDAIVAAIGTDDASIALIARRLGRSAKPGSVLDYARRAVEATRRA